MKKILLSSFDKTMIICIVLFIAFIFIVPWLQDYEDQVLMKICAGFVFGFAVDRVYMTIVHSEQEVRENEKSKYSYEVQQFNRYLRDKLINYKCNYRIKNSVKILTMYSTAMNPEEAYSDYKAFVQSMGTNHEEVEDPISEGEFEGNIS